MSTEPFGPSSLRRALQAHALTTLVARSTVVSPSTANALVDDVALLWKEALSDPGLVDHVDARGGRAPSVIAILRKQVIEELEELLLALAVPLTERCASDNAVISDAAWSAKERTFASVEGPARTLDELRRGDRLVIATVGHDWRALRDAYGRAMPRFGPSDATALFRLVDDLNLNLFALWLGDAADANAELADVLLLRTVAAEVTEFLVDGARAFRPSSLWFYEQNLIIAREELDRALQETSDVTILSTKA